MAIVDGDRDEIVIRILYDGPALAGKTTSIKALLEMLAARRRSELFTPGEAEGRTLYFDWMDYLGGWCDGNQVRCQIVSAPGQRSLVERRRLLLRHADVVVFVAESTPEGANMAVESFAELKECLALSDGPPVPVVMQANKQDLPAALAVDEVREHFADERHVAVIGSVASDGVGVREAFMFAVRLALDRVRVLRKEGKLHVGEPEIRSGEDLLSWIEGQEAESSRPPDGPVARPAAAPAPEQAEGAPEDAGATQRTLGPPPRRAQAPESPSGPKPTAAAPEEAEAAPALPTSSAPSGLVWRPMEGRIILHELEEAAGDPRHASDGSWIAVAGGRWHLISEAGHVYADIEEGRQKLLQAARLYNALGPLLSERRALTLAEAGDGRWRLWKIVRKETSLRDRLAPLLTQVDGEATERLFQLADALLRAAELFREAGAPLRAMLHTVGECDGRLCFMGIDRDAWATQAEASPATPEAMVRKAFGPSLAKASREHVIDAPAALGRLRSIVKERPERSAVIEALAAMLIGR